MEKKTKNFTKLAFILLALGASSSYGSFFHEPTIRPVMPRIENTTNWMAKKINDEISKASNCFSKTPYKAAIKYIYVGGSTVKDLYYLLPIVAMLPFYPRFSASHMKNFRMIATGHARKFCEKSITNKGMRSSFIGEKSDLYAGLSFVDKGFEFAQNKIENYADQKSVKKMFEPYRNITPAQETLDIGRKPTIEDLLPENELYSFFSPEYYAAPLNKEGDF